MQEIRKGISSADFEKSTTIYYYLKIKLLTWSNLPRNECHYSNNVSTQVELFVRSANNKLSL